MIDQMNTPTPAQALADVMALSEKATPGEWETGGECDQGAILSSLTHWQLAETNGAISGFHHNANFIVALVKWARQHGQHFAGLEKEVERLLTERRIAPVQGYAAGIPWSMHLEAYDAYCKRYGKQQALIEGSCRGGFGIGELDQFIPGWRERVSEITQLRAKAEAAEARVLEAEGLLRDCKQHHGSQLLSYPPQDHPWVYYKMNERIASFLAASGETK